jgi:NAD(P)-dependent dehydrogenase (short-subunit alcohol dehydrogenase family)
MAERIEVVMNLEENRDLEKNVPQPTAEAESTSSNGQTKAPRRPRKWLISLICLLCTIAFGLGLGSAIYFATESQNGHGKPTFLLADNGYSGNSFQKLLSLVQDNAQIAETSAKAKGSVINFASGAGLFGNFGQSAYAAAKEGIRGLSRVAATEWAKDGINVNVICPLAWTAQLEQFQKAYPDAFEKNVHTPPAGYFGKPEEDIGRVCVQIAHPDFKYMTGETLTLEGGLGLRP